MSRGRSDMAAQLPENPFAIFITIFFLQKAETKLGALAKLC